jgi:hypothetical protein
MIIMDFILALILIHTPLKLGCSYCFILHINIIKNYFNLLAATRGKSLIILKMSDEITHFLGRYNETAHTNNKLLMLKSENPKRKGNQKQNVLQHIHCHPSPKHVV